MLITPTSMMEMLTTPSRMRMALEDRVYELRVTTSSMLVHYWLPISSICQLLSADHGRLSGHWVIIHGQIMVKLISLKVGINRVRTWLQLTPTTMSARFPKALPSPEKLIQITQTATPTFQEVEMELALIRSITPVARSLLPTLQLL